MNIELSSGEFRQLLDMVYIGNWILNSTRGNDRIQEYDQIESKLFGLCAGTNLDSLVENRLGISFPSRAFQEGGIQEAIAYYEDGVFFEILAEELARRDMVYPELTGENFGELDRRIEDYLTEFNENGLEHFTAQGAD